jgi:histidinol-phosphate aminotransferase
MDGPKIRKPIRDLVRPHLVEMPGYDPVEPIDVMAKRLGLPEDRIVKLDANENPYGPAPGVAEALGKFPWYHIYPDPLQTKVRDAVAGYAGVEPGQVVFGNGSDELLNLAAQLFLSPGDTLINVPPTFGVYDFLGRVYDANVVSVPRTEDFALDWDSLERALDNGAKLMFLASPNNPTGNMPPREQVERILQHDIALVVDEAYTEFSGQTFADMLAEHDNLIIVRTFSKWAGLAGLRAGYGLLPPSLADVVWRAKVPYNLGVAQEVAILASLEEVDWLKGNVQLIVEERERMTQKLAELQWLRPFPSEANFVLCEIRGDRIGGRDLKYELQKRGILIRYYESPGLRNCIRISVGKPDHTDRLIQALAEIGAVNG